MFVDKVNVRVKAGNGGNGAVSFRHEKYVDKGGPDGGDGGNGGNVIAIADRNQDTLANFRYKKKLVAQNGQAGSKRKKHGKTGQDLIVKVPVGTVINDEQGNLLADLTEHQQTSVISKGGKGGFGNAHFVSSRRQAPQFAEKGELGETSELTFEIKLIADVGLVGLPNAGKSTLLASISNARPEIANYPFTTLTPNLGVVDIDHSTFLMADIPGLIEGASKGKGLGDEFLRHIERTSVVLHLIDAYGQDVVKSYKTIIKELKNYEVNLSKKPQIVVITKVEGLNEEIISDILAQIKSVIPKKTLVLAISAKSKLGLDNLLRETLKMVKTEKLKQKRASKKKLPILRFEEPEDRWTITKTNVGFVIKGKKIESFAKRIDFENYHGRQRIRDILQKMGVLNALVKQKIDIGQKIIIGDPAIGEIEY